MHVQSHLWIVVALLAGSAVWAEVAIARSYNQDAVAVPGDPIQYNPADTYEYTSVAGNSISEAGHVALQARASGSISSDMFVDSSGTVRAAALPGDPAPGTLSATYLATSYPSMTATGDVAFIATLTGVPDSGPPVCGNGGVFVDSIGVDVPIALVGQVAPGTDGGTFSTFISVSASSAGDAAFSSYILGGSAALGLFVWSNGTIVPVLPDSR